jgi:aromatic-L-amino-acid decarboxylase
MARPSGGRWASRPAMRPCAGSSTAARPTARQLPARPRRPASRPPRPPCSQEFATRLAPHNLNAYHPRALSYFTPPPLLMSIVGEVLAQVLNQGVDVWHAGPSSAFVEEEVGRWLCSLVGYGPGQLRRADLGRGDGQLHGHDRGPRRPPGPDAGPVPPAPRPELEGPGVRLGPGPLLDRRALDELGFPTETLHVVPADEHFRLRGLAVAAAIADDRARGLHPFAICAVAGSTNTGAVDRTAELADIAEREGLWLHVDAAYGGAARLSVRDAGRVADLERADSITIDPHKWFFQAYDIGALVVRRGLSPARDVPPQPRVLPGRRDRGRRPRRRATAWAPTSRSTSTSARWRAPAASGP